MPSTDQPRPPPRILIPLLFVGLALLLLLTATGHPQVPGLPFKDSDDVMRMLQVLAWLDGGDWYDLTQHRLNPPAGVAMHWSRLPDLPLLSLLWVAEPLLGRERAILLTVSLIPVTLGLAYLATFIWAARPFTGPGGGLYAAIIGFASSVTLLPFFAGRVDHHGWQLLLAMLMAGAVLRVAAGETAMRLAVLSGVAGGLALWVGAEGLPALALASGVLILVWIRQGAWGARRLAVHGLSLAVTVALILPLALAPGQRLVAHSDAFSLVSLALGLGLAGFGLAALLTERYLARSGATPTLPAGARLPTRAGSSTSAGAGSVIADGMAVPLAALPPTNTVPGALIGKRLLAALLLGGLLLALLQALFPQCRGGPYAGVAPEVAAMLVKVSEAQPLWRIWEREPGVTVQLSLLPLIAILIVAFHLARPKGGNSTLWLGLGGLVAGGMAVTLWQLRGGYLVNAYAGLALTWLMAVMGARASRAPRLLSRLGLRLAPFALVALAPVLAGWLVETLSGVPAAARASSAKTACDLGPALARLNQPPWVDRAPLLIAAPINAGARILWQTPHAVLAAPYHRNPAGVRDNERIMNEDEATAQAVATERGVDFILLCPDKVSAAPSGTSASLVQRLVKGEIPDWLEPFPNTGTALLLRRR